MLAQAATSDAENASRARGDFLAKMSHEIRTPMNGAIGMMASLQDTQLTAEQQDYVDTLKSSANILLAIINDMLDARKLDAGNVELEVLPTNLTDVLDGVIRLYAGQAKDAGHLFGHLGRRLGAELRGCRSDTPSPSAQQSRVERVEIHVEGFREHPLRNVRDERRRCSVTTACPRYQNRYPGGPPSDDT